MTMNSRKMNNYSLMRVSTVFVLTVALVVSTFSIPIVPRTGAELLENRPPNTPSNPEPINGSTGVFISVDLNWTGGDPDGDPVTYDVYFGTKSPPPKMIDNQSMTIYDPGTMNYSTKYFWQIVAWDNQSASAVGPQWEFTTEDKTNNPPYAPNNENPANESIDIALTALLSWEGDDPDEEDTVTYDVYFGTSSPPSKVASNHPNMSYDPGDFEFNTTYYWRIVAWDNNNASTVGDLWHFATIQESPLTVTITKPLENKFYFMDEERNIALSGNTIVYGKITLTANVTSSTNVTKVEFYADGNLLGEDTSEPYTWFWQPLIQFNGLSLKRTIKVIAYDSEGNNASAEINITKWRFHPLPWILAGISLASRLVLHTTVVGVFFNVQESRFSVSFYALRAHYKTVGPFQKRKGVVHFKHCTGGILIGPTTLTKIGPFHKFAIGSFTFIGGLNAEKIGIGGSLLSRLLERRTTGGGLLNLVRNLRS
jgi:hypothetical protein